MTRLTSLAAAAALVAGAATSALAQTTAAPAGQPPMGPPPGGPGGPGMRGGQGGGMQRMLFEGITLSAAQQATVDSIQTARRATMRARMQGMGGGGAPADSAARAALMQEMRTGQEQDRRAMRAVLTADQQPTFDANLARVQEQQMRQRMQNGPQGAPGGGPGRGGRD